MSSVNLTGTSASISVGHNHHQISGSVITMSGGYCSVTPNKYQENGDTLSDFVNLVCQETQNPQGSTNGDQENQNNNPNKMNHHYYNPMTSMSMLPPPPPAPMARPVPIIRTVQIEQCSPDIGTSNTPSPPGHHSSSSTPHSDHSGANIRINTSTPTNLTNRNMNGGNDSRDPTPTPPSHSSMLPSSMANSTVTGDMNSGLNSPGSRSMMMNSPFTTLTRADHSSFLHVHPQVSQVF